MTFAFPQRKRNVSARLLAFKGCAARQCMVFIAALDGIAVAIRYPPSGDTADVRKYYNRKGFYSIYVQATVSSSYRISFLSAKHAGSTHDSTAFTSTALHEHLMMLEEDGGLPSWAVVAADGSLRNIAGATLTERKTRLSTTSRAFASQYNKCLA
jgi:hypothetical protein